MQQVDEAVPVLASMDKDPSFRKAVSSLKAVHPPRNPINKTLPANLTKPKPDAPVAQAVPIPPCCGHEHGNNVANDLWLLKNVTVNNPACQLVKCEALLCKQCLAAQLCSYHGRKPSPSTRVAVGRIVARIQECMILFLIQMRHDSPSTCIVDMAPVV